MDHKKMPRPLITMNDDDDDDDADDDDVISDYICTE
jgi:hypothetical protein